jgi:hypothetical protein
VRAGRGARGATYEARAATAFPLRASGPKRRRRSLPLFGPLSSPPAHPRIIHSSNLIPQRSQPIPTPFFFPPPPPPPTRAALENRARQRAAQRHRPNGATRPQPPRLHRNALTDTHGRPKDPSSINATPPTGRLGRQPPASTARGRGPGISSSPHRLAPPPDTACGARTALRGEGTAPAPRPAPSLSLPISRHR